MTAAISETLDLLPKQRQFVDSEARFPSYMGGLGNGKTTALCAKAIVLSELFPGNVGMILRKHYQDLKDSTMKSFFSLRPDLKSAYRAAEMKVVMANGSEILFRHADKLQLGVNLGHWGIDQVEEIDEEVFTSLVGRLRKENVDVRQGYVVGNPAGHNWVWRRWKAHIDVPPEEYVLFEGTTGDNPHLPAGYLESLRSSLSKEAQARFIMGSWEAYEGLIWPEFSESRHVKEFEMPDPDWWHFRSIDYGFRHPFCCLWCAVDQDGNLWFYDEHYESDMVLSDHAKIIKSKSERVPPPYGMREREWLTYIDPSTRRLDREKDGVQVSVQDELSDHEIYTTNANNDVQAGIARVAQYLRDGRIKIHPRCKNLIREIQDYKWKEMSLSRMETRAAPEAPRKVRDDAVDAFRYAVMSQSNRLPARDSRDERHRESELVESRGVSGYGI